MLGSGTNDRPRHDDDGLGQLPVPPGPENPTRPTRTRRTDHRNRRQVTGERRRNFPFR